ncbi:MAG TPA: TolC family protein [Candidatus Aquilonibacter sp.]|nr:TolC family protein [Candidatus Aquilonibacter sp.]
MKRRNFCTRRWFTLPIFVALAGVASSGQMAPPSVPPAQSAPSTAAQPLTLRQAEQIAIQNHPRIQVSSYLASAAKEQVTEARSAYYPAVYGSLTGVDSENNSRIAAGALNNPVIYERYANGLTINQLVTDFGRTHELVKSSSYHAKAQEENVVTTRADVLVAVDEAYYSVLKSQAVLTVAQETVKERQLVSDQVTALEENKIKSGLDVSFANVDLAQARLLLIQAQNDVEASFAQLSAALGYARERSFQLVEQPLPGAPPSDVDRLIQEAMSDRPEMIGQRFNVDSAHSYATAQRDLSFPTLSAAGAAGLTPVGATQLAPRYAAAGFNLNIPIFNGHLFGALHTEASERARAEDASLRDLEDRISRDVRTAWLNANSAYQRLSVTDQLLVQANQALDLASARYRLGLSSIIELSQAQLNQTQAQIEQASAKYDYETQLSELNFQIGALH